MNKKVRMTKILAKLLAMYKKVADRFTERGDGRVFVEGEAEALRQVFKEVYGVLPMCHTNEDGTVGYHLIYAY